MGQFPRPESERGVGSGQLKGPPLLLVLSAQYLLSSMEALHFGGQFGELRVQRPGWLQLLLEAGLGWDVMLIGVRSDAVAFLPIQGQQDCVDLPVLCELWQIQDGFLPAALQRVLLPLLVDRIFL